MSLTGQQSSSRRKEKGPMEPLTPLQEKELENDSLLRQVCDFQQEIDEVRTENKDLKAEQMAKNEIIERLSNDLSRRELEIDSYKERNDQLQERNDQLQERNDQLQERNAHLEGLLEDLIQERYEELRASSDRLRARRDRLRASNDSYHSDLAQVQKVMGKKFGSVTLAASKTAETKERANPQFKQSGLHRHAEELESQKMSKDITEEEFETVKDKKNKLAGGSSSKAPVLAGSLLNKNSYSILDQDDPWKRPKLPKKAEVSNQNPADKMYVAPPPDKGKSDEQSRAGLTGSTPRPISYSAPDTNLSTPTGTSGWDLGDRHGFKTFHSKEDTPMEQRRSAPQAPKSPPRRRNSPQPEHVKSLATPHGDESVKDYAQVAATPARPTSGGTINSWDTFWENYNKRYGVKMDVEKEFADFQQRRAAKSSKPATTHGDRLLQSIDKDLGNALWSDDLEEDGGVEVTGRPNQSAAVDPSRSEGFTPIRQPAEAPLPPADRAPQISEHVGKAPQPRSQEAEIGPDNKTSPAKAKEQETHGGTDRLPWALKVL